MVACKVLSGRSSLSPAAQEPDRRGPARSTFSSFPDNLDRLSTATTFCSSTQHNTSRLKYRISPIPRCAVA